MLLRLACSSLFLIPPPPTLVRVLQFTQTLRSHLRPRTVRRDPRTRRARWNSKSRSEGQGSHTIACVYPVDILH
jgi:hypothetical protein